MEDPVTKNDEDLGSDRDEADGPTPPKKGRQTKENGKTGEMPLRTDQGGWSGALRYR
jgi:hypothetical protein